jgi:hypothetical protein
MMGSMAEEDPFIASALAKLEAEDVEAARDAEAAFGWLTWGEGLSVITREGLQHFLWYGLPMKWPTGPDHHRRVVAALARAFDLLDLPRYAALCRSDTTAAVLNAYERSDGEGTKAFHRADVASGIRPPDIDEVEWGSVMGPEESAALARRSGRKLVLTPKGRAALDDTEGRWRTAARRKAFLHGPRDSDGALGGFLGEALEIYARLSWRDTGIDPAVDWADLCEWCIWERARMRRRPGRAAPPRARGRAPMSPPRRRGRRGAPAQRLAGGGHPLPSTASCRRRSGARRLVDAGRCPGRGRCQGGQARPRCRGSRRRHRRRRLARRPPDGPVLAEDRAPASATSRAPQRHVGRHCPTAGTRRAEGRRT